MNYTAEYHIKDVNKENIKRAEDLACFDMTTLLQKNIGFKQTGHLSGEEGHNLHTLSGKMDLQVFSQETWQRLKIQLDRSIRHGSDPIIIKNLIEDF